MISHHYLLLITSIYVIDILIINFKFKYILKVMSNLVGVNGEILNQTF